MTKRDENSVRIAISARLDSSDEQERYIAHILRNGCPVEASGYGKLKGKDLIRCALLVFGKQNDKNFPLNRPKKSIYDNAHEYVLERKP
jgi:hypothetical protein